MLTDGPDGFLVWRSWQQRRPAGEGQEEDEENNPAESSVLEFFERGFTFRSQQA